MEVTSFGSPLEDWETQIFVKRGSATDTGYRGEITDFLLRDTWRVESSRFREISLEPWSIAEAIKEVLNESDLRFLSFGEEEDVIRKKEMRKMRTSGGHSNWIPITLQDQIMNSNRKLFHAKNEEIRWQGVSLPKTMSGLEGRGFVPVPEDREGGWGNTMHDELNSDVRKTKLLKTRT